ncbi:hypothetical protein Sjap_023687 [Stephania japonica]|uniref:Uncharacterized protein n=1 Tax=Stephania japonica TaxID=461633 RepID=A0AAP0HPG1_9MAGN
MRLMKHVSGHFHQLVTVDRIVVGKNLGFNVLGTNFGHALCDYIVIRKLLMLVMHKQRILKETILHLFDKMPRTSLTSLIVSIMWSVDGTYFIDSLILFLLMRLESHIVVL